jgi:hypothetical protein
MIDRDAESRCLFFARQDAEREARAWSMACETAARRAESGVTVGTSDREPEAIDPVSPERIAELAWYDDAGYYSGPEVAAEISSADRRFALSAEGAFAALCKERTGDVMHADELDKRHRQSAELLSQSKRIADKMAGAGFQAYRETPFELFRYFVHSRQVELLPSFRRTCFIPAVAQSIRAPMVSALEFWLSRNPFARFWTFSTGQRTRLPGVRDKVKWLHGKLNDLSGQPFMQEAGVRLVFRSTELGTPETDSPSSGGEIERDADGTVCFHVHAHVVVELTKGFIAPEKWARLVGKVGAFWPAWWGEGGAIRNARECCKYVTKPGEMLKLTGAELVSLQEQLTRLKLVQPLGSLAAEIRERETGRKRLVKRQTSDGRVYLAVSDWNKHARRTKTEADQDAAQKLTARTARGAVRIVSRGTPRFGRSGVAEPVVVVMAMRGSWHEGTVRSHALVAPVIQATVHEYFAGVAIRAAEAGSGIRVHTRTTTALDRPTRPRGKPKRAPLGAETRGF